MSLWAQTLVLTTSIIKINRPRIKYHTTSTKLINNDQFPPQLNFSTTTSTYTLIYFSIPNTTTSNTKHINTSIFDQSGQNLNLQEPLTKNLQSNKINNILTPTLKPKQYPIRTQQNTHDKSNQNKANSIKNKLFPRTEQTNSFTQNKNTPTKKTHTFNLQQKPNNYRTITKKNQKSISFRKTKIKNSPKHTLITSTPSVNTQNNNQIVKSMTTKSTVQFIQY